MGPLLSDPLIPILFVHAGCESDLSPTLVVEFVEVRAASLTNKGQFLLLFFFNVYWFIKE